MRNEFQADVDAITAIAAVPTMLDVICRATGMGFAAVARVTEERWVACSVRDDIAFGLKPGDELDIQTTLCREVNDHGEAIIIDNVAEDSVYRDHAVPRLYGFQSYISMPILRRDGRFFGTLCAIDPRPIQLRNSDAVSLFRLFAELIAFHLEAEDRILQGYAALLDARETSDLRDQFIAVLGHDLRNPLSSVASGLRLLDAEPLGWKGRRVIGLMWGSIGRMTRLTENILDLARGRLGNGVPVTRMPIDLAPVLRQVVDELQVSHPARDIDLAMDLPPLVYCDEGRIAQLVSNLLGNALTHGDDNGPVRVRAIAEAGHIVLTVTNSGTAIPPAIRNRLFEPFVRGGAATGGLGLGLYIASEIAQAHDGTLTATSDDRTTRFTVIYPMTAR